jgi:hypothetical protein
MVECFARMANPTGPPKDDSQDKDKVTASLKCFSLPGAVSMFAHGGGHTSQCNNDSSVTLASRAEAVPSIRPIPKLMPSVNSMNMQGQRQGTPAAPPQTFGEHNHMSSNTGSGGGSSGGGGGGGSGNFDADRQAAQFLASLSDNNTQSRPGQGQGQGQNQGQGQGQGLQGQGQGQGHQGQGQGQGHQGQGPQGQGQGQGMQGQGQGMQGQGQGMQGQGMQGQGLQGPRSHAMTAALEEQVEFVNNQYVSEKNRILGFPAHRDGDFKLV